MFDDLASPLAFDGTSRIRMPTMPAGLPRFFLLIALGACAGATRPSPGADPIRSEDANSSVGESKDALSRPPPPRPETAPTRDQRVVAIAKLDDPGQVLDAADWWLLQEYIATIASHAENTLLVARGSSRRAMQLVRRDLMKSEYADSFELGKGIGPTHLLTSQIRARAKRCILRAELVDLVSGLVTSGHTVEGPCDLEGLRLGAREAIAKAIGISEERMPALPAEPEDQEDVLLRLVDGLVRDFDLGFRSKAFGGQQIAEPRPGVIARVIDTPCRAISWELFEDPKIRFGESKDELEALWIGEGSPTFFVSETSEYFTCHLNDVPNPQADAAAASMALHLRNSLRPRWAESKVDDGIQFIERAGRKRLMVGYVQRFLWSDFVLILTTDRAVTEPPEPPATPRP